MSAKPLGNPANLVAGNRYAAIALVTAPKFLASDSAIASKVQSYGFSDVVAQKDTPPAGWPSDAAPLPAPSSGFYAYVLATWSGKTESTPMPDPIKAAWDLGAAGAGATPAAPPAKSLKFAPEDWQNIVAIGALGVAAAEVFEDVWTELGL